MAKPRHPTRLERRVGVVITAQITTATAFALLAATRHFEIGAPRAIFALTVAFAIAGSFEMPLELHRHKFTFTLGEAVLVVGFFAVGPIGLAIAAALGEAVNMVWQRHASLKLLFNIANRMAAAMTAGFAFAAFGRSNVQDVGTWGVALGAALCFSVLDVVSTATVVSIAEHRPFREVLTRSAPTGLLATLASASVGLVALDLAADSPIALLLLVPLAFAVALNSRYAIAQRDEHLRFERLYESSARTARLGTIEATLGSIAAETRALGTGIAALCCATDIHGAWVGAYADEHTQHLAAPSVVAAAVLLAERLPGRETDAAHAPELLHIAPAAGCVVAVSASNEKAGHVVLVVVRDGTTNAGAASRVETLSAFANNAALIVANALLHEERAIALARQIDLNRQKDDFIAAVSHELRTPLAVMLGSVHTLERLDGRITEAQRSQLFDMTIDQGGRLQRLIDELLLVAAAENSTVPLELETVDIASIFESIAADTTTSTRGRLVREFAEPGEVVTDRSKLTRVLLNLVENAAKYAPSGPIELRADRTGSEVRISVVDHGPGIPAEDRERVFDRFVQLDQSSTRRNGGTGLGLHLCNQLAGLLDGRLMLAETCGGGCTFSLTIPVSLSTQHSTTAAVATSYDAPDGRVPFSSVRARPAGFGEPEWEPAR
jgi:signal transduction histidine kinase